MYVILINDDNTMSATKKQRIIQRSKLVDDLWFLVKPMYNGHDMSNCTVLLEYLKPVSKKYKTEILVLSKDMYEDHLKYVLPVDTEFTDEAGSLRLQITFVYVDIDADGKVIQKTRKISPELKVEIIPISAWSDIVPDEALSAIDQRIIKIDAQIKAIEDMSVIYDENKADNIILEDDVLQLVSNGKRIGDSVKLNTCDCDETLEEGVPVVDFNDSTDFVTPDDSVDSDDKNLNDNVVEFDPARKSNLNNVIEF